MTGAAAAFAGVQIDVTFRIGLGPGRYVVLRDETAPVVDAFVGAATEDRGEDVLIVSGAGAPLLPDRRGLRRRPRRLARGLATEDVWLTRLTFVRGDHAFDEGRGAEEAVAALLEDDAACDALVDGALRAVNRAVRATRVATISPGELHLGRELVRSVRIGLGTPESLATGVLDLAATIVQAPEAGPRETAPLGADAAAMLAGRAPLSDVHVLLLRLAQDVAEGAHRRAAVMLPGTVELAAVELGAGSLGARLPELRERANGLAERARTSPWGDADRQAFAEVVRELWQAAGDLRSAHGAPVVAPGQSD